MKTFVLGVTLSICALGSIRGQDEPPIVIAPAAGPITLDGDLSDPGWRGATQVDTFWETNPGDNVAPDVRTIAWATYDDRFLYAAFECDDPEPAKIRAPYADRDNVSSDTDYAGIILDTRHDRRTAIEFLANPRGVEYDALQDDSSGNEDTSIDLYWEAAGRITEKGWNLEIRIPLSSLRYEGKGAQTWGIQFYRNRTRDTRYQYFSNRLPRGSNCFVCHERDLTGLSGLPQAGHLVVAPYATVSEEGRPIHGGSRFVNRPARGNGGIDAKWTPNADNAVDATINPDFSQVESDVAQISTNTQFALFYPEKRPFFLEGLDLFSTPIQAVYTRTITSPRWGLRDTGKSGATAYTVLVGEDRGGGSVIVPGPQFSSLAPQDYSSFVGIGRVRHDVGRSFGSFLVTEREVEGTGFNRVLGPDFQWSPDDANRVTGQFLYSATQTPERPDLDPSWDGRRVSGHAAFASWDHSIRKLEWYAEYDEVSDGFRADDGFVPQTGYRRGLGQVFYRWYPEGFFNRVTALAVEDYSADMGGQTLKQRAFPGISFQGKKNLYTELDWIVQQDRVGDRLIPRSYLSYSIQLSPSRLLGSLSVNGSLGDATDFTNARAGKGGSFSLSARIQPEDHLELRWNESVAWVDVDRPGAGRRRLFTAGVHRLKATYNFSSRAFLRAIAQYVVTERNPSLYSDPSVPRKDAFLSSSILFAYKLNWQTVLFVGYGDNRTTDERYDLRRSDRQLFLKASYAFQM